MMTFMKTTAAVIAVTALTLTAATAETRITYKSAKTGSSYYQMGVELAEAMKAGTDGDIVARRGSLYHSAGDGGQPGNVAAGRKSGWHWFPTG